MLVVVATLVPRIGQYDNCLVLVLELLLHGGEFGLVKGRIIPFGVTGFFISPCRTDSLAAEDCSSSR